MSFRTFLLPASWSGVKQPEAQGEMPTFDASQMALNGGPPPVRITRPGRSGMGGFAGLSQWASPQQADGLAGIRQGQFLNLPPVAIARRPAIGGVNQPLAQLGRSNTIAVPSTFVPVAGLKGG